VSFSLIYILPGDPALAILGENAVNDTVAYERLRESLGLDKPLHQQYLTWLGNLVKGDMGKSMRTGDNVAVQIAARIPVTLEISLIAIIIALLIAIPTGLVSARKEHSPVDMVSSFLAIAGVAVPPFWLGILLIYVFAVWTGLLPPSGYVAVSSSVWLHIRSLILPSITLGLGMAASIMRQLRSGLLDTARMDYIMVAFAKGLDEKVVMNKHAFRNALIPIVTVIGLQFGRLFGGAVAIETIFSIPGIGRLAIDSIFSRDYPTLQGVVLVMGIAVMIVNLITDLLYGWIDPRIRVR
jgi:peptide/nickel transport system permease protein